MKKKYNHQLLSSCRVDLTCLLIPKFYPYDGKVIKDPIPPPPFYVLPKSTIPWLKKKNDKK